MRKSHIALGVAAAFGASAVAHAVPVQVKLVSSQQASYGGIFNDVSASTATWSWETTTGVVTGTGLYKEGTQLAPVLPGQLFTHNITDLVIGGTAPFVNAASALSYSCVEGSFGTGVFASLCGNYNYGANAADESLTTWTGTSTAQTLGGDDVSLGPPQDLTAYDGMGTTSGLGGAGKLVVVSNIIPFTSGQAITFSTAVPVPAAVWLFGSALGLLGWVRRRAS